jgi:hypothetical protein
MNLLAKLILDSFPGLGTYASAAGLIGLGIYQASQQKWDEALATFVMAYGLIRARRGLDRPA